mgnify:CR=1 FL=1
MGIPVREIKGIGEKTEKLLAKLDIETVDQLVHHYPRCYTTYPEPISISEIKTGQRCSIEAEIASPIHLKTVRKLKLCTGLIADVSGQLFVRWFNMPYLRNTLKQGERWIFTGTPIYKDGRLMLEQPEYCKREKYLQLMETFQPIYPLTTGLSNKTVQKAQAAAFEMYREEEYLPETVRNYYDLEPVNTALREVHFPTGTEHLMEAKKRIIFDEFFRFFSALELVKDREEQALNHYIIPMEEPVKRFVENLPYPLTGAQKKVLNEIRQDFSDTMAMNRLLQGDVGSGKTIVAMTAMYAAVLAGYQAALMAPTEVLAEQHYQNFVKLLSPLGITVALLTGSTKAKEKREIKAACASGEIQILIGTHTVIQDDVAFDNLAFIVTDEQHRFGVKQRDAFMKKGKDPHVLVMSATPIPRTLGIILYRDLDVSIMNEMPASRLPIKNSVVGTSYRPAAWEFIRKQVALGHQAYVICPLVEASEGTQGENVIDYSKTLMEELPSGIQVGVLHGKMKSSKKNEIMQEFAENKIQVLVSTTVVEVGVNVPNATVMLIENADRFGLAQLHQLRGRVGRGDAQSYCIMINASSAKTAKKRLEILNKSNDGFFIASEDLKLRGPGDFFGIRQSGDLVFALADIYQDAAVLQEASEEVKTILEEDPELTEPGHHILQKKMMQFQEEQLSKMNL